MPRTTIDIDPTVLAVLKERSRREGKSVGTFVSELLAHALDSPPEPDLDLTWATAPMGALIDLDDKDRVRDALDER